MFILAAILLSSAAGDPGMILDRVVGRVVARVDKLVTGKVIAAGTAKGNDSNDDSESDSDEEDTELEAVFKNDGGDARITEKGKRNTVDMLHRIAQTAGWSMTLVGSPKERIDVDIQDADPRDALRQVLKQSGAMGVLKRDKLVVVASPDSHSAGQLVEQVDARRRRHPDYLKGEKHGWVKGDKHNSR
ncbi:MAG TPA: hypothetical protein VKC57_00755, partial [Ktedonobacterales bacterium]|nr:hypothetical protein [Ktedonobacterales bacterium]